MTAEMHPWIRSSIASIDDLVDHRLEQWRSRFGWHGLPHIQPYIGYANDHLAWFHGRVLRNPPHELPAETDQWWNNLQHMLRRFASDEVPGAEVEIDFAGRTHRVRTDAEGYFQLETSNVPDVRGTQPWKSVAMRLVDAPQISPRDSTVISKMLTPLSSARFGIISDIDDTVLHTGITGLREAIRLTFFHNARTRKPLPGVAALYRALQAGAENEQHLRNPIFYISSSPWNLFDLLEDFFELNAIPAGPILLRDIGFDRDKFIKEGHVHKLIKARRILSAFPHLPFVLLGDSGQEDAQLYAQAAVENPAQIKAIYIRDVDPSYESPRDDRVRSAIVQAASVGVPMLLISNSIEAARSAQQLGLIHPSRVTHIVGDASDDFSRTASPAPL